MKNLILFFNIFVKLLSIECQNQKPNVIFILADDLGWGDVGLHGSSQVKTPNIDVLATNGIILNNYYVSPVCSPSRGALMTGRHPIHIGLQHRVFRSAKPEALPYRFKILPRYLKKLGYDTHALGKWHLGFHQRPYLPTNRGFDTHFGFWTGHEDYYTRVTKEHDVGYDFRNNEQPVPPNNYTGQYSTHIYSNKTIDIILQRKGNPKPLFLYLAHQSVHGPLQVPKYYSNRLNHIQDYSRRTFAGMVSALDDSVGELMSAFKMADILNNTIIVFSTDNGGAVSNGKGKTIDGMHGSNWPLRGAKYTLFEGGIRGFAFIWSPLLKRQYVSKHLMHIQDWLPTIYHAVGGRVNKLGKIDGINMWDILKDNLDIPRKHLLHNIDDIDKHWAIRVGDYKLISGTALSGMFNGWYLPPGESIKTKITKSDTISHRNSKVYEVLKQMNFNIKTVELILEKCNTSCRRECRPKVNPCLFDLRLDPCEYYNIWGTLDKHQSKKILDPMLSLLSKYRSTAVKPIVTKVNPNANPKKHKNRWVVWQNISGHDLGDFDYDSGLEIENNFERAGFYLEKDNQ